MAKLPYILLGLGAAVAAAVAFWFSRPADLEFTEVRDSLPHSDCSRFAVIDGVRIHYQEKGSGQTVVLLHGYTLSAYSWRKVFDELASRWRVLAVDLRGFGLSGKGRGDYSMPAQAGLVVGLLDHLGIDQAVLCGSSMGGTVALACALQFPDRVSGLILVDSVAFTNRQKSVTPPILEWPVIGAAAVALAFTSDVLVRRGLAGAFHDKTMITEEQVLNYYRPFRTRDGQTAVRLAQRQWDRSVIEASLEQIQAPTLIIWGKQDTLYPLEQGRRQHARIAGSELVVFENCGHLPQEEMPERFVQEVNRFLEKQASDPSI